MKYLILSVFLASCGCQSATQNVLTYQREVVTEERRICKQSYVFLKKCESITNTRKGSAESGQDMSKSGK